MRHSSVPTIPGTTYASHILLTSAALKIGRTQGSTHGTSDSQLKKAERAMHDAKQMNMNVQGVLASLKEWKFMF